MSHLSPQAPILRRLVQACTVAVVCTCAAGEFPPADQLHWRYPAPSQRAPGPEAVYGVSSGGDHLITFSTAFPTGYLRSPDGILWEPFSWPKDFVLYSLVHGDGQWVSFGTYGNTTATIRSRDGRTWESTLVQTSPTNTHPIALAYSHGTYVALGSMDRGRFETSPVVLRSTNGLDWTYTVETSSVPGHAHGDLGFCAGDDRFVRLHWYDILEYGQPLVSLDGVQWTSAPAPSPLLSTLAYGNGMFLGLAYPNNVVISRDGTNWTVLGPSPISDPPPSVIRPGVGFAGGYFYTTVRSDLAASIPTYISTNGVDWIPYSIGPNFYLNGIAYHDGTYLFSSARGESGAAIHQLGTPAGLQPRLGPLPTNTAGSRFLLAAAPPSPSAELESSTDLRQWDRVALSPNLDGLLEFTLPEASNPPALFYRLRVNTNAGSAN